MSSPFSANQTQRRRLVTLTDVTERDRYHTELERKNDRLEEFASIVSHDLRNPFNAAEGRLALAMVDCESEYLEPVADAHDRMAALIEDRLLLARQGDKVREPDEVGLAPLVQRCWETVDTSSATLAVEVDGVLEADPTRLQQLLENLIRNAIDHGGPDVTITVGSLANGFYLEDDGPGSPAAQRAEVFEAGYSNQSDGTGFGLYVLEQIVKAHDRDIRARAGPSDGARFEITGIGWGDQVDTPGDH